MLSRFSGYKAGVQNWAVTNLRSGAADQTSESEILSNLPQKYNIDYQNEKVYLIQTGFVMQFLVACEL